MVPRYVAQQTAALAPLARAGNVATIPPGDLSRFGPPPVLQPAAPPPPEPPTEASFGPVWTAVTIASVFAAGVHGTRRNDSVGWGIAWGVAAAFAPILVPAIAVGQGFGQRRK